MNHEQFLAIATENLNQEQRQRNDDALKVYSGGQGMGITGAKLAPLSQDVLKVLADPNWASGGAGETRLALDRLATSMGMQSNAPAREVLKQAQGLAKLYLQESLKTGTTELGQQAGRVFQSEVESIENIISDNNETPEGMVRKWSALNRLGDHWDQGAQKLRDYVKQSGGVPDQGVNDVMRDHERGFHMYFPDQKAAAQTGETPAQPLGVGESKPFGGGTLKRVQ